MSNKGISAVIEVDVAKPYVQPLRKSVISPAQKSWPIHHRLILGGSFNIDGQRGSIVQTTPTDTLGAYDSHLSRCND